MNNDHELLEAAAKAIGERLINAHGVYGLSDADCPHGCRIWNPLTDDGDALRLAVKFELWVYVRNGYTDVMAGCRDSREMLGDFLVTVEHSNDPCASTRRAIVLAAAKIGGNMK
ncbi:MAG: hypothetical protein ACR2IJ_00025 [Fluviibacter sp.]